MTTPVTITAIRPLTQAELDNEGWSAHAYQIPYAIVVSDGTIYYPSRDEEGNGPGAWFGHNQQGEINIHDDPLRTTLIGQPVWGCAHSPGAMFGKTAGKAARRLLPSSCLSPPSSRPRTTRGMAPALSSASTPTAKPSVSANPAHHIEKYATRAT